MDQVPDLAAAHPAGAVNDAAPRAMGEPGAPSGARASTSVRTRASIVNFGASGASGATGVGGGVGAGAAVVCEGEVSSLRQALSARAPRAPPSS